MPLKGPHEYTPEELQALEDKYQWVTPPSEMDWRDPQRLGEQYQQIFKHRIEMLDRIRQASPDELQKLRTFYRHNKVQFIIDFAVTFDPRAVADNQAALMPFVPFAKQLATLEWFDYCLRTREYGLLEKSRESGATWLAAAWAATYWLFEPGFIAGFGSRKEQYVDEPGNPKSIFWKIRKFLEYIPPEFMPAGFLERKHSLTMRIINPENGAALTGEAGDNIGRGDRTTVYFVDEAAFLERPLSADAALSATTNCRVDISTSNGPGTPFYAKITSGEFPIMTFHWKADPRKDDDWYKEQKRKLDPIILAQEVDIDHHAATADNWIDGKKVQESALQSADKIHPIGPTLMGVDAAHMGDDESVITLRQGRKVFWQKHYRHKSGPELAAIAIDLANDHPFAVDQITVELDGPGVSFYDNMKLHETYGPKTVGVHTGRKLSDGRNFNVRARMYRKLKQWFDDAPTSIPNDRLLIQQLGATPYTYRDGKLLLKSKREVKQTGSKSPDRADSLALTFAVECNTWVEYGWKPEDQDLYSVPQATPIFR